ncbi:AAA family ATPase [Oceanobacter antarcticus]|jgi:predicted ATP-binding protein involved in virulence|uniref:AAA family ATPase n=1 Tax=Oceanobacter antarcticus TaxID=3133425 RepID=A0ABW8NF90_9GAMM|tara:strand:+ start:108 stop:1424 length:1317 start_codon:yes stop_codon:yes gene_type:complete
MKIRHLKLDHFRRFDSFEIDFHEQLTVLVARNGAGKTSILDALAIALGPFLTRLPNVSGKNPKDSDFQVYPNKLKPPFMRIQCQSFNELRWDRTEKRDQTKKTASHIPEALGIKQLTDYADSMVDAFNDNSAFALPLFAYYGTGRGVFDVPQRKRGFGKEFPRFEALSESLESRTNFKRFVEYFYALEDIELKSQRDAKSFELEIPELKAIREAIHRMLPEFSNPRGAEPAGIAVDWNCDGTLKELRIEQLSDGYRITLAMVMDIAARMAEANPDIERSGLNNSLDTEGVILIDEVDLHLHPGWQQTILLDLQRTFPNIQFIVTTHSPQVISSVKPECLRVIEWHDEQPSLHLVEFSEGAESQRMLLDVLGVESSRVEQLDIVQKLKRYQQLVFQDQWDSDEAQQLHRELRDWGQEYEPELLRLDMDVRMKEWERTHE